jgi:hypothetical protein
MHKLRFVLDDGAPPQNRNQFAVAAVARAGLRQDAQ